MTVPSLQVYQNGQNISVSGDNLNTMMQTCNVVNDLRSFIGVTGIMVFTRGTTSIGDGGQGTFYWNASGIAPDDNGVTTIVPHGVSVGEWTRLTVGISGNVTVGNLTATGNLLVDGTATFDSTVTMDSLLNANTIAISAPPSAGDNSSSVPTTSYLNAEVAPLGQCLFKFNSSTTCVLIPFNGNKLVFPSGAVAVIPAGGISTTITNAYVNGTAAQTLSPTTLYYAYLANVGGTYVIDWSTTAYATDSTGIQVKSGDSSRALVGMAYPNTGPVFISSGSALQVRSWYNDTGIQLNNNFSTTRTTASGTPAEINSEIRCNAVTWTGESALINICGTASNATNGDGAVTSIGIDSTSVQQNGSSVMTSPTGGQAFPAVACISTSALAEGFHFFTLLGGNVTGGTVTWQSYTTVNVFTSR